ncbi:MAG: NUDIX domain-containing protein [Acidimicrobiales bacterium]
MLLAHPGGPYFAKADLGAWTIPKGEHGSGELPLAAAEREFAEEIGSPPPAGDRLYLGEVRQQSGKVVTCFAVEGDLDVSEISSNSCEIEWPPRSGRTLTFPEVDRAAWFAPDMARKKLNSAQALFVVRLVTLLDESEVPPPGR